MYDFVVIGDIMTDHILQITDPDIISSVDEQKHLISFPYPAKMQMERPPLTYGGGNAFTAAMVLRSLGMETAIYSVVGKDHEGERLISYLRNKSINVDMVQQDNVNPTNNSFIFSIGTDRVIFSHHHKRQYKLDKIPETKYLYLTSLGEDDSQLFTQLIEMKKNQNFFLLFSPGTLQVQEDFADIKQILQITDLLVLDKFEAKQLSRLQTESNENLLKGLHQLGPKQIIMTRSKNGSIAYDGTQIIKVGARPVSPVESTGAGDTYTATVGAALAMGKDLKTAMEWGALHAARVICEVGANRIKTRGDIEKDYQELREELVYQEPQVAPPPQPAEHAEAISTVS